jgi:hypothetical protein
MAVVMTTKFYEEDTPAWHDLSKIVFTSPNITSPNTAGTRSHILPGQGNLALWYESTSHMYEIEPIQDTYDTSFYYYHFTTASGIDLDSSPTSALVTAGNYPQFVNFIKRELNVEVTGFTSVNSDVSEETLKLEYTMKVVSGFELDKIYLNNVIGVQKSGCQVEVISDILECYIDFEFIEPTNVTYIRMEPRYGHINPEYTWYFIGNFKIQGKTNTVGASWVDLYTGANTTNVTKDVFMTDNTDYYTYYKIVILNNTSLVDLTEEHHTWDKDYYAISGLVFYGYEYSSDPGTGHVVLYSFDDDVTSRELHVVNAAPVSGNPINTTYDVDTDVEGTINISTFDDGGVLTTRYTIDTDKVGTSTDYHTQAVGDSITPVISGTTGATGTVGTTTVTDDAGIVTNGYIDVTGETKIENGYIQSNLSGQQTGSTYSDNEYDITTDITYTTVISGAVVSGTIGDVAVAGYTNRYEDRDSSPRSEFYDISFTDTVGTTLNHLITGDYVRVSALAFRAKGTILAPNFSLDPNNYIASPIYNRIFKGNTVYNETNYYYGDFSLGARTEPDMIGDYLIFKPMLYNIDDTIPYGIHDHVIVLHYTYT